MVNYNGYSELAAALRRNDDEVTSSANFSQHDGLVAVGVVADVRDLLEGETVPHT